MNYRQVEVFKAIMQCGSITDAAEILHVSQPAISKSLKMLEHDLGVLLFTRTTKGLLATNEARLLYTEVERVSLGFENLKRFGKNLHQINQGRLVVGVIHTLGRAWMTSAVAAFTSAHQQISVSIQTSPSNEMARQVGNGQIDVGIAQWRTEDYSLSREPLFDLNGLLAVPKEHPLAAKTDLQPQDLHREHILSLGPEDGLRQRFERAMAQAEVEFHSRIDATLGESLCGLVEQGCGIGIVDDETARLYHSDKIVFLPFCPNVSVPIFMIRAKNQPPNRLTDLFVEFLRAWQRPERP